jgi:hypothetical protein
MEDGSIRNSQLTASSFLGAGKHPIHGRLNKPRDYDGSDGGWRSLLSDESKWFQIDFLNHVKITGVSIQGFGNPAEFPAFTKTFKVAISNDGKSFVEYTDRKHPNVSCRNFEYYYLKVTNFITPGKFKKSCVSIPTIEFFHAVHEN